MLPTPAGAAAWSSQHGFAFKNSVDCGQQSQLSNKNLQKFIHAKQTIY